VSGRQPSARGTAADRLRWLWKWLSRWETLQLRVFGTTGMAVLRRTSVLLLETTGRRSGRRHRTPVAYWERGGAFCIGGGAGGMTKVDWVANLRARGEAVVWVRRRRVPVVAREFEGEQCEQVRAEAFERWPGASKYERTSGRRIPYFELVPTTPDHAAG